MSQKVKIKIPKYNIPVKKVDHVLLNLNSLLPHEEIVTERLNDIVKTIKELNAVDMPIIVAPIEGLNKYLIVDGHHRWAALKEIGVNKIPSIVINYFDPNVKVYTWYPAISGDFHTLVKELRSKGINILKCDLRISDVTDRYLLDAAFIIFGVNECLIIKGGVEEQRAVIRALDKLNVEGKVVLSWYGLIEDAEVDLRNGEVEYVFVRRAYTKKEIMDYVSKGGVYPPKTTRHVLPFIPAKNYVRLETLYDS